MRSHLIETPMQPIEGFDARDRGAREAQAAFILAVGAAADGETEHLPSHEQFEMPSMEPLEIRGHMPMEQAVSRLDVEPSTYRDLDETIPTEVSAQLVRDVYQRPEPETGAALVEAGLHSDSQLVRVASAISASSTTGPREDTIAVLERGAQARDIDVRELARTGLAQAAPTHELLDRYVTGRADLTRRRRPSHTAVLTHGTWASRARWWQPGGDFYGYLDRPALQLNMHDRSYRWSGVYSHEQRRIAADDLRDWIALESLQRPDMFAHSHGATVTNLATRDGLELTRFVAMGMPVHEEWLPDLARVQKMIDVRVNVDLVILADRGGQRLSSELRNRRNVVERRHGWFSHASTHEREYWERYDIPSSL